MTEIEAAFSAISDGEMDLALGHLLAAWRVAPAPDIAEMVDEISARACARVEPLVGATPGKMHAEWLRVAAERRDTDLPRLLDTLTETNRSGVAIERLEAIASWDRDPRFLAAAIDRLRHPWIDGPPSKPFWSGLLELLVKQADPRTVAALHALPPWGGVVMGAWMSRQREKTLAKIQTLVQPDPDPARLARFRTLVGAVAPSAQLLVAVLEAPDDDGRRLVYGDSLHDDPRAELIALQFARQRDGELDDEGERREHELLQQHGRAWMGKIAPLVGDGWAFERGFLSRCSLSADYHDRLEGLADDPSWATVTELRLPSRQNKLPDNLPTTLRSLRAIEGLAEPGVMPKLLERFPSLNHVGYWINNLDVPAVRLFLGKLPVDGLGLPGTGIYDVSGFRWLWSRPIGQRLKHLRINANVGYLQNWLDELATVQAPLETFTLRDYDDGLGWTSVLSHNAAGRFRHLDVFIGPKPRMPVSAFDNLIAVLDGLKEGQLTTFRLHRSPSVLKVPPALKRSLARLGIEARLPGP